MKCDIIKDLIPLCQDNLCSEESKKEVLEHIKTCENCRKLYDALQVNNEEPTKNDETPSQIETFKKVKKNIKAKSLIIGFLVLILIIIIGALTYLTVCQIGHFGGSKSFETIFQSLEVKKIVNYLVEGDIDSYVDSISKGQIDDLYTFKSLDNYDVVLKEKLKKEYIDIMKDNEIETVSYLSAYSYLDEYFPDSIINTVYIKFKGHNEIIAMRIVKNVDGKYLAKDVFVNSDADQSLKDFASSLNFANNRSWYLRGAIETVMVNPNVVENSSVASVAYLVSNRFNSADKEKVKANLTEYYNDGYIIDNVIFSNLRYDDEMKMFYYEISVSARENNDKAVMTTKIYYDEKGMYSPDEKDTNVLSENCSEDFVLKLKKIFG